MLCKTPVMVFIYTPVMSWFIYTNRLSPGSTKHLHNVWSVRFGGVYKIDFFFLVLKPCKTTFFLLPGHFSSRHANMSELACRVILKQALWDVFRENVFSFFFVSEFNGCCIYIKKKGSNIKKWLYKGTELLHNSIATERLISISLIKCWWF